MFNQAHDFSASGIFVEFNQGRSGMAVTLLIISFERLFDFTTRGAAYNSHVAKSKARCLEGTRTQYIQDITGWATGIDPTQRHRLMWMHGPAGVGKSAVAKSCAEKIAARELLGASFFFSRETSVNNPSHFFTTIAHQLAVRYPEYKKISGAKIEEDPDILTRELKSQFQALILTPFLELNERGVSIPHGLVIIDGLDECDGDLAQAEIVDIIGTALARHGPNVPLLWAIFSRPERHIVHAFSKLSGSPFFSAIELPVSRDYDGDILLYFRNVLQSPSSPEDFFMTSSVEVPWPSEENLITLVKMVAGLFIYAATVARFIMDPDALSPERQLASILSFYSESHSANLDDQSPITSELDAFYSMIMSHVPLNLLTLAKEILLIHYTFPSMPIRFSANHLGITLLELDRSLSKLRSVLAFDPNHCYRYIYDGDQSKHRLRWPGSATVRFYHASFEEYLLDQKRSGRYCIRDLSRYNTLAVKGLQLRNDLDIQLGIEVAEVASPRRYPMDVDPKMEKLLKTVSGESHGRSGPATKLRELLPQEIRTGIDRSHSMRWQYTALDAKSVAEPHDEHPKPFSTSPTIETTWASIKQLFFTFQDDSSSVMHKLSEFVPKLLKDTSHFSPIQENMKQEFSLYIQEILQRAKEQNVEVLDEFDLVSYYDHEWDAYYWRRNVRYCDQFSDSLGFFIRAAMSAWEEFFLFLEGQNHRLTRAVFRTLRSQRMGDILRDSTKTPSGRTSLHAGYWMSIGCFSQVNLPYEEYAMAEYRRAAIEHYTTEPVWNPQCDFLHNLENVADRLSEEGEYLYSANPRLRERITAVCAEILMEEHWEEMYARFEELLSLNQAAALGHLRTIWQISKCHSDAANRVSDIFKARVKRIATDTIDCISTDSLQPLVNPADRYLAPLLNMIAEQTDRMDEIFGDRLVEGHRGGEIVDRSLDELASENPQWNDVVHRVVIWRKGERDRGIEKGLYQRKDTDSESSSSKSDTIDPETSSLTARPQIRPSSPKPLESLARFHSPREGTRKHDSGQNTDSELEELGSLMTEEHDPSGSDGP
ncbi:hypothetical protein NP233_g4711 [Leucocoprinus birnbaumii]|uniref:CTLH domain-containing protein n=1 Tax=Leucocoprinus birnbaumii TaxID=56174 RepID=A0AAD5W0L4_9AGAR|nr:hypothetical protein NP233_g4711 [Leucocoprinus birnbaumii]